MNEILFDETQRYKIIKETASNQEKSKAIVEKDFWVTWVLGKIFADEELSKILMFKGGTSLSKVFHLINRFSEDIDLILDRRLLDNVGEFETQRSKNQQDKFNHKVKDETQAYLENTLVNMLNKTLSPLCECVVDNNGCIKVRYDNLFADVYVKPDILLEIGALASWLPSDTYTINSFIAEQFPNLKTQAVW